MTGPGGTVLSESFNLTVEDYTFPPPSKLINISTRSFVGTDADALIAGFIIGGATPKKVLIRASGPALVKFGLPVTDVLPDPVLSIHSGNSIIATNNNWGDDPSEKAAILAAFGRTGVSAWDEGSKDSAVVLSLNPGGYTANVNGNNRTTGVGLVEVFEIEEADNVSKLINISSRSLVKTGADVQIAGFIISGKYPKKVIIRASGPALAKFGVPGVLADPKMELHSGESTLAVNDNWDPALRAEFQAARIDNWDVGSKDAALIKTLAPGAYTVVVSGVGSTTGVALLEVYDED